MRTLSKALAEQLFPDVTFRGLVHVGTNVVIHPGAVIGESVKLCDDVLVMRNAVIGDYSYVGRGVTIRSGCVIPADRSIDPDYARSRDRKAPASGAVPLVDADDDYEGD